MEDITTRAIFIGVSVLIAVATISAVMTYYSTAQEMVRKVGSGTDIAGLYDQGIEESLLKDKVTGVEVKNLINYFEAKRGAKINFNNANVFSSSYDSVMNFNGTYDFSTETDGTSSTGDIRQRIIPSAKYNIVRNFVDNILNITVTGGN